MQDLGPLNTQYEVIEQIGKGTFGVVYKVRSREDKKLYAIKEVHCSALSEKEQILVRREVTIMSNVHHPFAVSFIQKAEDKRKNIIWIVMEYCGGGDLEKYMLSLNQKLFVVFFISSSLSLKFLFSNKKRTCT